jgi:hypothetical protein
VLTILLSVFIGLVVGGGCMALVAARHIGAEAARQFDRGVVKGRDLVDGVQVQPADEAARRRRVAALA